jgi:hypothetical protein
MNQGRGVRMENAAGSMNGGFDRVYDRVEAVFEMDESYRLAFNLRRVFATSSHIL